ncbi:RNA polymerase sigma-70 factor (ECF subfamily) [Algoriphagus sp. 4150]|uniref:RNA polymerase sigma factor n=1 Tax=Algoriphagus sp. 4150 TaxID=2817756 RepID=UPI002864D510|nr:sigma-70 family RNA polymerase sigma factor [Algoriphagus sp. 4150]MDR7130858.1 RNA polymerase sigma-70 factor (ECF subfamily) [Algoriphagus sp. 4150]
MKASPEHDKQELQRVSSLSDEALVRLIVETRESSYYGILYDRYADKIYNRCLRFIPMKAEAQDLTHDLFIKLYYKLKSYEGRSSFSTWLYSFTYNFCLNHINRKHKVKQEKEQALHEQMEIEEKEIDDSEILALKAEKLKVALDLIDPNEKLILLMKYQDEFSVKEIAESLQLGESAVKMRINRAKKKVLEKYNNLGK